MIRDETTPALLRPNKRLALIAHRKRVQGITKKLYKPQAPDQDSQVTRKLKSQIDSLKSASIKAARQTHTQSFSSIRNLSMEMLNDMMKARRKKEVSVVVMEEETTDSKLPPMDAPRLRAYRLRPSILDMKALSQQMSPLVHRTEQVLRGEEEKSVKSLSNSFLRKGQLSTAAAKQVRDGGELRRDIRRLAMKEAELARKTKLYVTSIALLEDELRELVADCLEFKRSLVRKKLDCAYHELRRVKHEQVCTQSQREALERSLKTLASMPATPFCLD